jgi:hypothetical protein
MQEQEKSDPQTYKPASPPSFRLPDAGEQDQDLIRRLRGEPFDSAVMQDYGATADRIMACLREAGPGGRPGLVEHEWGVTAVFMSNTGATVFHEGRVAGMKWAYTAATLPQLRRLEELHGLPDTASNKVLSASIQHFAAEAFFENLVGGEAAEAADCTDFLLGFRAGAMQEWGQVKDEFQPVDQQP